MKRKPMTQDDWRQVIDLIAKWYEENASDDHCRGVLIRVVSQSSLERYSSGKKKAKKK